jgi:hypothetical protein
MLSSTTMQIATALLLCGLALATLLPAPAANEDGLLTALLGIVCCATLLMGGLALFGMLTGTAVLATVGAAIMVPCAWLARAPEAPYDYEPEDDDGGGSPPPPRDPSPPPGPEHWRPTPAPAGIFATARTARTALAQPAPALASAAGPRAGLPANPRFPHLAAVAWGADAPPAPGATPAWSAPAPGAAPAWSVPAPMPVAPPPLAPPVVAAPAAPEPVFQAPAVRPGRGDHRSAEHRVALAPHTFRRRRHGTRLRMLHGWRRRRWFGAAAHGEHAPR